VQLFQVKAPQCRCNAIVAVVTPPLSHQFFFFLEKACIILAYDPDSAKLKGAFFPATEVSWYCTVDSFPPPSRLFPLSVSFLALPDEC